jgi:hypothetical protein
LDASACKKKGTTMPQTVKCTNVQCGTVFEVPDEKVGETVYCPQCGAPTTVGTDAGQAEGAGEELKPSPSGVVQHPARQQCPNCGAVLGVRVAICPQCGADIRTGAVQVAERKKKRNLTPYIIGGGVLAGVVVLLALVVVAILVIKQRKGAAPAPVAQPGPVVQVEGPKAEEKPKAPQVAEEALGDLGAREQQIGQAVAAYRVRLKDALAQVRKARPDEMAGYWADLYAFCRDNGLRTEAEQCWLQAVQLGPTDRDVNAKLGRTETFAGRPVTPEQKTFLESLSPRVRLINRDSGLGNGSVAVGDAGQMPFGWSDKPEFRPRAGSTQVVVSGGDSQGAGRAFPLTVEPGLVYSVTVKDVVACPLIDLDALSKVYAAVSGGEAVQGVAVETDWQGRAKSARAGGVQVAALEDTPVTMQLGRNGDTLGIVGTLTVGNRYGDKGQDVLYGSSQAPVRLLLDQASKKAIVNGGVYYALQVDLADGLWGALATAEGDFGSEWARKRLTARLEETKFRTADLEARGEFYDPFQADARIYAEMDAFQRDLAGEIARQNTAGRKPNYLDRVRFLGISDRDGHLYMNWPSFRAGLTAVTQDSYPALLDELALMSGKSQPASAVGAGPLMGPPPGLRISGPMGSAFGSAAMAGAQPSSAFEPAAVALDKDGRLYALMSILPILPDGAAMEQVRRNWDSLNRRAQMAALVSLETIATPEAVSFLGRLSQESRQTYLVTAALLSLGVIGTPTALQYCESPAIVPEVRMAAMAAKVAAGDGTALDGLPEFLNGVDAKSRGVFLGYVTALDTPATLLVLESLAGMPGYQDAGSRAKIAGALVRIGGLAASSDLAQLMAAASSTFPDLLGQVRKDDAVPLVRPVGQLMVQGKVAPAAVAFLAAKGGEAGHAFVKTLAVGLKNSDAVWALLDEGSAPAIETATGAAAAMDLAMLEKLSQRWFSSREGAGQPAWSSGVDPQAGRAYLSAVFANAADPKVRLAAAKMLLDIGEQPDVQVLVALAAEPKKQAGIGEGGAPASYGRGPGGRGPGGPPAGTRFGPPAGIPFGPAQPAAPTTFAPKDFEEPKGAPLVPQGFKLDGRDQLYALGLLAKEGGAQAAAALRDLAGGYKDVELKTAAMVAIGRVGGDENLQFLRAKATLRKDAYGSPAELVSVLQERLEALIALGSAQDGTFVPTLLDILTENAPLAAAVKGAEKDYDDLSGWWEVKLWTGACKCLSQTCRDKQLPDLIADSSLQKQMVERLLGLMEEPGPERPALSEARKNLQAEVVVAFGRSANAYDEQTRLVLGRLAMGAAAPAAAAPGGARPPMMGPGPGFRPSMPSSAAASRAARAPAAESLALRDALRDAAAHMAVHGGGLGLLTTMPGVLPKQGTADARWSALMVEMAAAPTPDYFTVLGLVFDSLSADARDTIYRLTRGKAGSYDTAYAQFVAKMIKVPLAAAAAGAGGRRGASPGRPAGVPAVTGPPPAVQEYIRQMTSMRHGPGAPSMGPMGPGGAAQEEVLYARQGPWRILTWAYSLQRAEATISPLRQRWALVGALFESNGSAVGAAVQTEDLMDVSDLGPAIAAKLLEVNPSMRGEVLAQLGRMLASGSSGASQALPGLAIPAPAAGAGAAPRASAAPVLKPKSTRNAQELRRGAVMALRRAGGDDAGQQLFLGLVGPQVQEQTPGLAMVGPRMGPPPGVSIPHSMPTGRGGPIRGPGLMGATTETPAARYIARALGTMGRDDLLRSALSATDHTTFNENPAAVQTAVLDGMAYLPQDRNPLKLLSELLKVATTADLRAAAAEAIGTAVRLLAGA